MMHLLKKKNQNQCNPLLRCTYGAYAPLPSGMLANLFFHLLTLSYRRQQMSLKQQPVGMEPYGGHPSRRKPADWLSLIRHWMHEAPAISQWISPAWVKFT